MDDMDNRYKSFDYGRFWGSKGHTIKEAKYYSTILTAGQLPFIYSGLLYSKNGESLSTNRIKWNEGGIVNTAQMGLF